MLLAVVWSLFAVAAEVEYRDEHLAGASLWTDGLLYAFEAGVRYKPLNSSSFLFENSHLSVLGHVESSPAYGRLGPVVYFEPIAFLDLRARLYGQIWYGTFSTLVGSDDPKFVATPDNLRQGIDDGKRQAGRGGIFDLRTRLKVKGGPVIAMGSIEWRRRFATIGFREPVAYYWDSGENLVVPGQGGGVVWCASAAAFVEAIAPAEDKPYDPKLWVGATWEREWAKSTGDLNHRAGLVTLFHPGKNYAWPLFFVSAQLWLESRFMDIAPPYLRIGASWER